MTAPKQHTCRRCSHQWWARIATKPVSCPRCRSPYWDRERTRVPKRPAAAGGTR